MRFTSGFQAAALAGTLLILPLATPAQAAGGGGHGGGGGFGGGAPSLPGIGPGAYAPGQGPVGAQGWSGGSWNGYQNVIGPLYGGGYGGYGGRGGGGGPNFAYGGSANLYNYNDYRQRDGGFYGGGGVFYGDNGYGRSYTYAPAHQGDYDAYGYRTPRGPGYGADSVYHPSQHIFYLPDNYRGASRKRARVEPRD